MHKSNATGSLLLYKGVGVHRAENLDTYWQEFHRGEGVPIFFHFLVRCAGRGQTAFFTCQVYVSFGEGARDRNIPRQTSAGSPRAVHRAPSNSPNLEGSMCLDVRRKYINLVKLRALRIIVKASWAEKFRVKFHKNRQ
ncbi:hypothetical protein HELRODRAFT_159906 [Helobdella robusta]|uniref:Uncharacterized protein n=1 Tax=Helobdella robusta TaxID=6412 RepID=T1EPJ4_HELRO|nr:hypothetical protein HELRODRAFT_159906 [Helobdella robusta]ESO05830.1 hypothetical protein HELRODRAFT_159906 [Helobdella robusta]